MSSKRGEIWLVGLDSIGIKLTDRSQGIKLTGGKKWYNLFGGSSSRSKTSIVQAKDPSGCEVASMAMAAGVSYEEARQAATNHGFQPNWGIWPGQSSDALRDLGVENTVHEGQPFDWDDLRGKKAIVEVYIPEPSRGYGGSAHTVLYDHGKIYDCNGSTVGNPHDYQILDRYRYTEIHDKKSSRRGESSSGYSGGYGGSSSRYGGGYSERSQDPSECTQ